MVIRMEQIVWMSFSLLPWFASSKKVTINRLTVKTASRKQGHGTRTLVWALTKFFDAGADHVDIFSTAPKGLSCVAVDTIFCEILDGR
jgi:predicted GNAT family N-acyltransferase